MKNKLLQNTLIVTAVFIVIEYLIYYYVDIPVAQGAAHFYGTTTYLIGMVLSSYVNWNIWSVVIFIGLIIAAVRISYDRQCHWAKMLLYVCLTVLITSTIGYGLKYLLGRYRPPMFLQHGIYGFHYFSSQWISRSMPSGHNYTIFSAMVSLALVFRRYGVLFILFAALVGFSRIIVDVHYLSDVLFGAYLGTLSAVWTYYVMFHKVSFEFQLKLKKHE